MAVSNTGSRNGLITWAVVATVLGLGSLIWAVISFTQASKAEKDLADVQKQYLRVVDRPGLTGPTVTRLTDAAGDASRGFGSLPLLEVASRQAETLTQLVGGSAATSDKAAIAEVQAAVEQSKTAAGADAALDTSSLTSTIRGLGAALAAKNAANAQLASDLEAARAAATAAEADKAQVVAVSDQTVADATRQATDSQANAAAYSAAQDQQLASVQEENARIKGEGVKAGDDANTQLNEQRQQNVQQKRELDELRNQLKAFRVPTDQIATQADGEITRTAGSDVVFINLGRGDGIAAGMTFEVFDKLGVPRARAEEPTDDALLKGKASIEVVKVDPGISQCRIVRLSPGVAITEGDPIVNLVFDKNVKFNFHVFGRFNLDDKGVASDRDTDVVRRLISGWGGNVADALDAKTDFVVLGEEPVVPNYTQDQLAREPEKAFEKEQAETALEQYTDIRARANQLNIPLLNQKRFLFMIGYYEEARR